MQNNSIIIDSSALVALSLKADSSYKQAYSISKKLYKDERTILLPHEVFGESINIIGKKLGILYAAEIANDILSSHGFSLICAQEDILNLAINKLKKQPNSVSYIDCLVMAIADSFETKEIFGFDDTFRRNGYKLPKE